MSHKLVLQIANKQLAEATETLHEELATIVDAKLHEKKKMIAAGALNESKSVSSGFLTVSHKKGGVHIAYGGNMGHTEKHVAAAFDKLHGEGAFEKVKPHGKILERGGNVHDDPSYSYVRVVPTKKFNSALDIKDEDAHYAQMNKNSDGEMKKAIGRAVADDKAWQEKKGKVDESYPGPGKALRAALKMHFAGGAKSKLGAIGTVVAPAAAGALAGGIPGAVGAATLAEGLHANDIRKQYSALRGKDKGTLNYGPDYADKVLRKKLDEGILNKVKKVVNKVGQAERLGKKIDFQLKDIKRSKDFWTGEKGESEIDAKLSRPGSETQKRHTRQAEKADDMLWSRKKREASLQIRSGRVGGAPEYARKNPKGLAEGILNKVKKAWNKIGQAKRLEKMIKDKKASNEKAYAKASAAYDDAVKRDNLDDRISTSKEQVARSRRRLSLTIMSGRVGRFKSFKRKNPKGLAEGKNPDRNLSDAGKKDNIHKLRVSADREDPAMSGTLERIAAARERAMKAVKEDKINEISSTLLGKAAEAARKKTRTLEYNSGEDPTHGIELAKASAQWRKISDAWSRKAAKERSSIKEGRLSAKEAADIAVEKVGHRTEKNEKARLARKKAGYPERVSDKMTYHDKPGEESFGDWRKKRKGKVDEATEQGLEDHHPRIVSGVKGVKSKPFIKHFKNAKAMDNWMERDDVAGDYTIHRIEKASGHGTGLRRR